MWQIRAKSMLFVVDVLAWRREGWQDKTGKEVTGCLAQLGERRPYKADVVGSIPSAPKCCN
jgi:hypothetical protein